MLRRLRDPVEFVRTHNNVGGAALQEARRMLAERRERIEALRARQDGRKARIEEGARLLQAEVDGIVGD